MHIFKKRQKLVKKDDKQAQATIFFIVGTVILIALILGIFIFNDIRKTRIDEETKLAQSKSQAEEIEKLANECIKKASFEGLLKLGQKGGYLDIPNIISFKGTSMWHLDQANIQPILNQTQERLLDYINVNIQSCIDDNKIKQLGFGIQKDKPSVAIEYGNADVIVKVLYPIKLTKDKFIKDFSGFFNTFNIRYRSVYEAASEINDKTFDADFDTKNPLNKLEYLKTLDFSVAYTMPDTDMIIFTVTDKKSITPTNELYTFSFAAKLGKSDLKKITYLQNNSATNPSILPFTIYSVDNRAQLFISPGTTVNLNGQPVQSLSVHQTYPQEVVTKDVPVYKKNSDVVQRQDIKYVIDNQIDTFEPSGILFNKFEKLTIYYDKESNDALGVGILMGKNGFWVPIPSKQEREQKRVFSNILGFTQFTAINCASQKAKQTIAEHYLKPSGFCFVSLVFSMALIAFTVFGGFMGVFSLSSLMSSGFAGLGADLAGVVGVEVTSIGVMTTIGVAFTTLTLGSLTASIIGATTDVFYGKSPDNCETFYPVCDQNIAIEKSEKDGTGSCMPNNGARVAAGAPVNVCAQVKNCNFASKFFCKPCSVKCTAQFY